jgi:hypothetical protein
MGKSGDYVPFIQCKTIADSRIPLFLIRALTPFCHRIMLCFDG